MTREFIAELENLIGGMGNAWPRDATMDCKQFFSGAASQVNNFTEGVRGEDQPAVQSSAASFCC